VKDVALWLVLSVPILARPSLVTRPRFAVDIGAAVLALLLMLTRRRWPLQSLLVGVAVGVIVTVTLQRPTVLLPIAVILLFTVALTSDRRHAIQAGLFVLLAVVICIATLVTREFLEPALLAGLAWPLLAVSAGSAVKTRHEALIASEERALLAEATRDDEARRRVIEERLYIARELHDVVAHKIAIVNVQAGVASHLLRSRPDDAANALAVIRTSAREVLDELADLLGVLRTTDEEHTSTEPTPTLDDIAALVESFLPVGLHVSLQTLGAPQSVSSATAITAYRAIQEALTNAHKHGDGHATVRIRWETNSLSVQVSNRRKTGSQGTGAQYGLIGMRERVNSVGGHVTAAPQTDGSFHVDITLPLTARAATA
jgi:signal transduction histidine kinase